MPSPSYPILPAKKSPLWLLAAVAIPFVSWPNAAQTEETILQHNPVKIALSTSRTIFPKNWLSPRINATGEPLRPDHIDPSLQILNRAFKKYPAPLLKKNLRAVYLLDRLKYRGIAAGGTNSRKNIYLTNRGKDQAFTDDRVERIFHQEFSSILLRNFPSHFDHKGWKKINPPPFRYGKSGITAIQNSKNHKRFGKAWHRQGFLYRYALSTLENDFNAFAGWLFVGDNRFWSTLNRFPKLRKKGDLTIAFYHRLSPQYTRQFFRSLPQSNEEK